MPMDVTPLPACARTLAPGIAVENPFARKIPAPGLTPAPRRQESSICTGDIPGGDSFSGNMAAHLRSGEEKVMSHPRMSGYDPRNMPSRMIRDGFEVKVSV